MDAKEIAAFCDAEAVTGDFETIVGPRAWSVPGIHERFPV